MRLAVSHPWDLPVSEAKELQERLARHAVTDTTFEPADIQTVAGVDVSVRNKVATAAVVVLAFPSLTPLDHALFATRISYPYIPGLLTFREGPCVLGALEKLAHWPDLFVYDGHGRAHPRRVGLATHMGVILDCPTIGCAKSRLVGTHEEPGQTVGDWVPLVDNGEIIGAVVRSRSRVKPIFVSIGHRVDLATAIDIVLRCGRGLRLPETTRLAHKVAGGAQLPLSQT